VLFTNLAAWFGGFALFAPAILTMNFIQAPNGLTPFEALRVDYGFGVSPTSAGLVLLPGSVLGLACGLIAAWISKRHGSKWPLAIGMLMAAVSLSAIALFHDHLWQIVVAMTAIGMGVPLAYAGMAKLIVESVKQSETAVASGMNTIIR